MRPTVEDIAQAHGVTRQAFYKGRKRLQRRADREEEALAVVREERHEHPKMGTRKLYREHYEAFRALKIGRDKLFDVLRANGLLVRPRRRSISTTNWRHHLPIYTNLIEELEVVGPDQVWVSDITYVSVQDRFMYVSLVTDVFSRKIVGYHLSGSLATEGTLEALKMALDNAHSTQGLIHHSDRGIQYCSHTYVETLHAHGATVSMTRGGNPYENAIAERVNGTLKHEYMLAEAYADAAQAREALEEAVRLYNERRPHLSLDYRKPADVYEHGYKNGYSTSTVNT